MNSFTARVVRAPLECHLVPVRAGSLADIRHLLAGEAGIRVVVHENAAGLPSRPPGHRLVILEIDTDGFRDAIATIHRLVSRKVRVIAVADSLPDSAAGPLWLAGACCVVTNRLQLDKVAEVVRRCRADSPLQTVEWRDDFFRRLPWGRGTG